MSYLVEVVERVEFTFKRKVSVDKLIGIEDNIDEMSLGNLDEGEICDLNTYITKINYGENSFQYKFLNGMLAVKVNNIKQSKYLINLVSKNGVENSGEDCIKEDSYIEYPFYYVRPDPNKIYSMERHNYVLWAEDNIDDIHCDEIHDFEKIFKNDMVE